MSGSEDDEVVEVAEASDSEGEVLDAEVASDSEEEGDAQKKEEEEREKRRLAAEKRRQAMLEKQQARRATVPANSGGSSKSKPKAAVMEKEEDTPTPARKEESVSEGSEDEGPSDAAKAIQERLASSDDEGVCAGCGKKCFAAEAVVAIEKNWHPVCLKCVRCGKIVRVGGFSTDHGEPVCLKCTQESASGDVVKTEDVAAVMAQKEKEREEMGEVPKGDRDAVLARLDGVEGDVCARCHEKVYLAEGVTALDQRFHKGCLKCEDCGKLLSVESTSGHEGKPYCKVCLQTHVRGELASSGDVVKTEDVAAVMAQKEKEREEMGEVPKGDRDAVLARLGGVEGDVCARCHKKVYLAEGVTALDQRFHKGCLKCEDCGKLLSVESAAGHKGKPYCKVCLQTRVRGELASSGDVVKTEDVAAVMAQKEKEREEMGEVPKGDRDAVLARLGGVEGDVCARCHEKVYLAEGVTALDQRFHKGCLKCEDCGKLLSVESTSGHEGKPYCKVCLQTHVRGELASSGDVVKSEDYKAILERREAEERQDAPRGNREAVLRRFADTSGDACAGCGKRVYLAESVTALDKTFHRGCLKCKNCNKLLNQATAVGHESVPYCRSCHDKLFMRRGSSQPAEVVKSTDVRAMAQEKEESERSEAPRGNRAAVLARFSQAQGDMCARCEKRVYFAEGITVLEKRWHKSCLRCKECNKRLSETSVSGHAGEAYCRGCHSKLFIKAAPTQVPAKPVNVIKSTDVKALAQQRETEERQEAPRGNRAAILARFGGGDGDKCPRCDKRVYMAEAVTALEKKWHKLCLRCKDCNRMLSAKHVCGHMGEAYCKSCHASNFLAGASKSIALPTSDAGSEHAMEEEEPEKEEEKEELKPVEEEEEEEKVEKPAPVREKPKRSGRSLRDRMSVFQGGPAQSQPARSHSRGSDSSEDRSARAAALAARFGGGDKCPKCGKSVYTAEAVTAIDKKWHKNCLRCASCDKILKGGAKVLSHGGQPYCRPCHAKHSKSKPTQLSLGPHVKKEEKVEEEVEKVEEKVEEVEKVEEKVEEVEKVEEKVEEVEKVEEKVEEVEKVEEKEEEPEEPKEEEKEEPVKEEPKPEPIEEEPAEESDEEIVAEIASDDESDTEVVAVLSDDD